MTKPISAVSILYFNICKKTSLLVLLALVCTASFAQPAVSAVKGVLDLKHRNWHKNGLVDLNGEWEFYWNALYTPDSLPHTTVAPAYAVVPSFWNSLVPGLGSFKPAYGFATYHLKVLCPPSDEPLQLKFLTVASAYKLYVNGRQITETGRVGTTKATTKPAYQPQIFPVTPENEVLDIVIQVANFNYNNGGLWDFIKLGTPEQIHTYQVQNIARDFFIAGSFLLIGLFYAIIYFFVRGRASPLYFALFCILIAIRPLVTGEMGITYITNWNWQLIKHIEFLFLYLALPVLSLFSYDLFPKEFSKKALRNIIFISVPFVLAALIAPPYMFRYTLRPFQVFLLVSAFYGLYVYIRAVKKRRTGSIYFLAGFVILFITVINDILYTSLLVKSTNLVYAGLYILVVCQAIALARQFFRAFDKVEKLNSQLESINQELNHKNDTINKTNEQLSMLNAELDTLVFRTSHDLRSPITSVYAMADIIKLEDDKEKRNEYVDFQKKTLMRLNALISEILQYAKNKSTALHPEEINLEEFVQHALQDHTFSYNSAHIRRIVHTSQSAPFFTDKTRLAMVLNNLISNGLKHHNHDHPQPYLKINVRATEKEAEIEVTDNGHGIAEEHLEHIFTKFYRVNTKLTGSGFGLYIVKETIEKMGGTIRVVSKPEEGTSFFVVIPNMAD